MNATKYYATINGIGCNDLNAAVNDIKCPICGQKMDVIGVEKVNQKLDCDRELDSRGRLIDTTTYCHCYHIKWVCMNCTAELTATAKDYCETTKCLDAEL